jgi:transcriptional regulator with XRE-family HTH domain
MGQLKKQFGQRVKRVRLAAGITQERLADSVGVTIETISNIERGVYGPSFDTLEKLAAALNTPVHELFIFSETL